MRKIFLSILITLIPTYTLGAGKIVHESEIFNIGSISSTKNEIEKITGKNSIENSIFNRGDYVVSTIEYKNIRFTFANDKILFIEANEKEKIKTLKDSPVGFGSARFVLKGSTIFDSTYSSIELINIGICGALGKDNSNLQIAVYQDSHVVYRKINRQVLNDFCSCKNSYKPPRNIIKQVEQKNNNTKNEPIYSNQSEKNTIAEISGIHEDKSKQPSKDQVKFNRTSIAMGRTIGSSIAAVIISILFSLTKHRCRGKGVEMKKYFSFSFVFILGVLIGFGLSALLYQTKDRYELVTGGGFTAFKRDKVTGKVWMVTPRGTSEIPDTDPRKQ